jgi:2C-methyl-D-erythritol 2,4-cyclodiphosphate synthase
MEGIMSEDLIKEKFDNHEERITSLEHSTKILETMNYRIGQMETTIKSINQKLDSKEDEKGKKWDKLIDYLFYFIIALILGYVAYKLGIKK